MTILETIYLINDKSGEEAAYKVLTAEHAKAIQTVDPGARRCSQSEYKALMKRMAAMDGKR